jgi:TolA-binding protein
MPPQLPPDVTATRHLVPACRPALAALLCALLHAPLHAQDLSKIAVPELEHQSSTRLQSNDYAGAVPYLAEMVRRLGDDKTPEVFRKLERVYIALGFGQMMAEQFAEATQTFQSVLERYPETVQAIEIGRAKAASHARLEQWDEAAAAYNDVLKHPRLDVESRNDVILRLSESLHQAQRHAESVPHLRQLLQESRDPELKSEATTLLIRAYIGTGQINDIYALVFRLDNRAAAARFSLPFNLSLLEGGDKLLGEDNPEAALLLYKLVLSKEELISGLQALMDHLTLSRNRLIATKASITGVVATNERLATTRAQIEKLTGPNAPKSYTEELRIRIGRAYHALNRPWEAHWTFWGISDDFPDSDNAEDSLFSALSIAGEIGAHDQSIGLGRSFLEKYPESDRAPDAVLQLANAYVRKQRIDEACAVLNESLSKYPDRPRADDIIYMLGYCQFLNEQFDEAYAAFDRVPQEHPDSPSAADAGYWSAMTRLFAARYDEAAKEFARFLENDPPEHLAQDAAFRRCAALYGLGELDNARESLDAFIEKYPAGPLRAEAETLLGDIFGSEGRLDDALRHYRLVADFTTRQDQLDLAAFQIAKVLEARRDWDGIIKHFEGYLAKYGAEGNYSQAAYQLGLAKRNAGDTPGMLALYLDTIERYGNDPDAIGIDLLLPEYANVLRGQDGAAAIENLKSSLATAQSKNRRALALRLRMVLETLPDAEPAPLTPSNEDILAASPGVLAWIGGRSLAAGDPATARRAYERLIEKYALTQWSAAAFLALARMEYEADQKDNALAHLEKLIALFPTAPAAGEGLVLQADILRAQGAYDNASELYELVLQVREWKGALWAEALYKLGLTHMEQGEPREAFAYFQRVYVLYQHYTDWTARAYLQSALCLEKLGQPSDAVKTLKEMLGHDSLQNTSEFNEARQLLARLEPLAS